jgi:hypothetical protein
MSVCLSAHYEDQRYLKDLDEIQYDKPVVNFVRQFLFRQRFQKLEEARYITA